MKLTVTVKDEKGSALYCKIVVRSLNSGCAQRVETVYSAGKHIFSLEPGLYHVTVTRGKLYMPYSGRVEVANNGQDTDGAQVLEVILAHVTCPEDMGWYSFDAHSHVSRDSSLATGNLKTASTIMRGEGFNFFFAGSPYDNETHLEYLNGTFPQVPYAQRFADDIRDAGGKDFKLCIGNELIKCRYGHVFMMIYEQQPPFSRYFDHAFDPWLFTQKGPEPVYEIDYIYKAILREKTADSVAVSAHPTSWWWHDGEFITNIASTLGFELLAGTIDAMVIMGYDRDNMNYQKLWLDALQNGYCVPGVAETDAAFDTPPSRHLEFKTYTNAGCFDVDALCKAVKAGKNMVSSGPLLFMTVNGETPGAVLPWEPENPVLVDIWAIACCEALISRVQIIVNGRIHKEINLHQGEFTHQEALRLPMEGFVLAKCYDFAGNVAITNPVYIRNTPFANHDYRASIQISVYHGDSPAKGIYWTEDIRRAGTNQAKDSEKQPFEKSFRLQPNITDDIYVEVAGETKTVRLFELPELQWIFKNLYFGGFNRDKRYLSGEVPAAEFKIREIKNLLDSCEVVVRF